jgi:hypothetical protein
MNLTNTLLTHASISYPLTRSGSKSYLTTDQLIEFFNEVGIGIDDN